MGGKRARPAQALRELASLLARAQEQGFALVALDCALEPTPPRGQAQAQLRASFSVAPVASVAAAALAYGVAETLHASGFLSVYIVALWIGNTAMPHRRAIIGFHQGLAFLAEVALFIVLGLLVFPSRLGAVAAASLGPTAVLLLARPLAVFVSTLFQGFGWRDRGLRGDVTGCSCPESPAAVRVAACRVTRLLGWVAT